MKCTERDKAQPKSETDSDQSQCMRSRESSTQPVLAQENFWDLPNSPRNCSTTFSVRLVMDSDSARHSTAQGTRRTQTHRNTMPCNTTVDTKETSIFESSGHEDQHCRSLHETSEWIANTVARKETWTSNLGWYDMVQMVTTEEWCQLRAVEQFFQSSRGVSILRFKS